MTDQPFWKPEPKQPWHDWRTWGMFAPLLLSMLGFAFTGLFAFAFSDLGVIPPSVQSWMVIIGSGLIVAGAEMNTPFTVIEVFRKILRKEADGWDTSALIASLAGTAINVLVTFASRQTLLVDSGWRQWVMREGPLFSGIAVTLDYYGGMIELGFLFGSYEIRLTEYKQWLTETGQSVTQVGQDLTQKLINLTGQLDQLTQRFTWLTATADQVKQATAHLNGEGVKLTRQELGLILAKRDLNLPSPSTVKRGLGG